jgi:MYXO-CTERM domain-containing protein
MTKFGWMFLTIGLISACEETTNIPGNGLPQAEVSGHRIEFGEVAWGETAQEQITIRNTGTLPLGVSTIALGTNEMEANFALNLNHLVSCDGGGGETTSEDPLSGGGSAGGSDTGLTTDGVEDGTEGSTSHDVIILQTGCSYTFDVNLSPVSVGAIFGSVIIDYATQAGEEPEYYRDPDLYRETVILEGRSDKGAGNVVISPRTLDFGYPYPGEDRIKYVEIHNVGNGELTVEEPVLNEACNESYIFDFGRLTGGTTLPAHTSTLFPVSYTASMSGDAECEMTIGTNDVDTPSSRVSVRGQMGSNPLCTPPTVDLVTPAPGAIHGTSEDLVLELRIHDADQPPTTLHCSVTSMLNTSEEITELANCTPYSESGYTLVSIPSDLLLIGTDTLLVTVRDDCGFEDTASTSVVYRATYPPSDDDGDGYASTDLENPDCDDDDVLVFPFATEIYDGKDNDCDGEIDEDSDGMDDDGDGHSEADGDCNDADDTMYPGAPEQSDTKDNDCNGIIDDNTGLYDDDGDGFAETDNDCNDTNPDVHPAAIEYCDGIDNNCNGLKDQRDGCIEINGAPMVLGEIQMGATALGPGESTIMTIDTFDPDGEELIFAWQEDEILAELGHNGFDAITTQTVTWTAPTHLEKTSLGEVYTLYVVVTDSEGNSDWAFGEVTVYPEPVEHEIGGVNTASGGCGNDDDDEASSALLVAPLMLLTLGLRRRRED